MQKVIDIDKLFGGPPDPSLKPVDFLGYRIEQAKKDISSLTDDFSRQFIHMSVQAQYGDWDARIDDVDFSDAQKIFDEIKLLAERIKADVKILEIIEEAERHEKIYKQP